MRPACALASRRRREGPWRAALAARGVALHGLCTWWDVLVAAERRGYTKDQLDEVRSFLDDPDGWAEKRAGVEV